MTCMIFVKGASFLRFSGVGQKMKRQIEVGLFLAAGCDLPFPVGIQIREKESASYT